MWVELPEAVDVAELEKAAAEREVLFVKGTDFLLEGGQNTLRLAYSGVTPEQIDEGITKLADGRREPWRRGIATATTPRSTACCTARGRSRSLIHGGFWKAEYDLTLMDALCEDLAGRGWAAWNIEYRRLGNGGGVPATLDDVTAAIDHLADARRGPLARRRDRPLRGRPPRGVGGDARASARGGHAASSPRRACWTSQRARELRLSDGVVDRFLGGAADAASPRRSSACRSACPALLTHGGARRHRAGGDQRALRATPPARRSIVEPDEDHFGHIDPANPLWKAVHRMALTRDDAMQLDAHDPLAPLPRALRHHRRAPALPRRQLARPPAQGHARARCTA